MSFFAVSEGILNIPGNKLIAKGYNIEKKKLRRVSLNNIVCVLLYTAQKQEIKYQKNNIKN